MRKTAADLTAEPERAAGVSNPAAGSYESNMSRKPAVLLSCALAAVLALTLSVQSAFAQSPGLDQYVETIPNADGNNPTKDGKGNGNGGKSDQGDDAGSTSTTADGSGASPTVSDSGLDALRERGGAGRGAAEALAATSKVSDKGGGDGKSDDAKGGKNAGPAGKGEDLKAAEDDGEAAVPAVLSSVFGDSGVLLPIIMLAVLVGGLALAARARRAADGG